MKINEGMTAIRQVLVDAGVKDLEGFDAITESIAYSAPENLYVHMHRLFEILGGAGIAPGTPTGDKIQAILLQMRP